MRQHFSFFAGWMLCANLIFMIFGGSILLGNDPDNPSHPATLAAASLFDSTQPLIQEKLWLHTDKPYYGAGDKIWFKAYLVDAASLQQNTPSNFIYVELIDRKDSVVLAKKIKRDSMGFANNFQLPPTLPAGDYILRAYSGWMLNFDGKDFFQKNITIGNALMDQTHTSVTYDKTPQGKQQAIVRFTDNNNVPYPDENIHYQFCNKNGKIITQAQQKTTVSGAIFVELPEDSTAQGGYLRVTLKNERRFYRRDLFFPETTSGFGIQFLPEGGGLIAGADQRVAFKAETPNGQPIELTDFILDQAGDTVVHFQTQHQGMGALRITPTLEQKYRAIVTAANGESQTVELPTPQEGYTLCANLTPQTLWYRIERSEGAPDKALRLIAHTRGVGIGWWDISPEKTNGALPTQDIPEGVLHLLLTDTLGQHLSERLVFIRKPEKQRERWCIESDTQDYVPRQRIELKITGITGDSTPLCGDFSLSITNRKTVILNPYEEEIRSNLLLCSDLRGYIHEPGYYFGADTPATRYHIDLVMMTHGWRRFGENTWADSSATEPQHFFEYGQYIQGDVIGSMGRVAPQAQVTAIALQGADVFGSATADSNGKYVIEGLDFRDTTLFILSAKSRKGRSVQQIRITPTYTRPKVERTKPLFDTDSTLSQKMEAYLETTKNQYYTDGGMKVYQLSEAEVTATNPNQPRATPYGTLYDTAALAKYKPMTLYNYVVFLPGVRKIGGEFFMPRKGLPNTSPNVPGFKIEDLLAPVSLSVNGVNVSAMELTNYTVDDVEYLNLIHRQDVDGTYDVGVSPIPCVIEIVLKEGVTISGVDVKIYKTIGYAENVAFYHPLYDTPAQRENGTSDTRTTLYWNPALPIDSTGTAQVSFYSDDTENPAYDIILEGITPEGRVCRHQQTMNRPKD